MHTVGIQNGLADLIDAYAHLVRERETDVTKWQAVHRQAPMMAPIALTAVCACAEPEALGWLLYSWSESPAMLFVRLGDGISYYEPERFADFASAESAAAFHAAYPDWFTWCAADYRVNGRAR